MADKCALCGQEITQTFLEKSQGTIIKIKKEDRKHLLKVCKDCQKQFKDKLKQELEKFV